MSKSEVTRKGIILAGGTGTRLYPLTEVVSKQLLPIYNKPMIYYPLSVLMLSGIREIAIITTQQDQTAFKSLLGNGDRWGLSLTYIAQERPDGLAQAYLLAEDFLAGAASAMVLGDNIFFGHGLTGLLQHSCAQQKGGTVFGYLVPDPHRYGVVGFDDAGKVNSIEEKPTHPASHYAITGLYFLDASASERARRVQPSSRGEFEITELLQSYLDEDLLLVERMGRGYAWFDAGTHASLLDAGQFIRTVEDLQGIQVGNLEEIAFHHDWIDRATLGEAANRYAKSGYGRVLQSELLAEN